MVVCTIFTVALKDDKDEEVFLEAFRKLQAHVLHNEPGTLTYELHQRTQEDKPVPHEFCVVERYNSVRDFEAIHLKSTPFADFFEKLGSLPIKSQTLSTYSNVEVQAKLDAIPLSAETKQQIFETHALTRGFLVFAGSNHGGNPAYAEEARALGEAIASVQASQPQGAKIRPLVYGGGTVGLMGEVAMAVKKGGGKVVSVIPSALAPREASGEQIGDVSYFTSNMSERKSIMFAHSDCVVALPGGLGTFDELLEVLTLFQLNAYRPKIGLVNAKGFFDPFLAIVKNCIADGFVEPSVLDYILVDESAKGLMAKLAAFQLPESPARNLVWTARP